MKTIVRSKAVAVPKSVAVKKNTVKVESVVKAPVAKKVPTIEQAQKELLIKGTISLIRDPVNKLIASKDSNVVLDLNEILKDLNEGPSIITMDEKQYRSVLKSNAETRLVNAKKGLGCKRIKGGNGTKNTGWACGENVIVGSSKTTGIEAIFCSKCISTVNFLKDSSVKKAIYESGLNLYNATGGKRGDPNASPYRNYATPGELKDNITPIVEDIEDVDSVEEVTDDESE